jgi:excinuclease ABC subunit A
MKSIDTRSIEIRGARTHNLCNIDLTLPRDKLIVFTGLSGSGKSSLAFDTIYAEGQRRYVESLSAYARQFLSMMEKPDVDHIDGLSPAISIEQKSTSHNPRSTVGTVTEIYDYLRLLYARAGIPRCPDHDTNLEAQTVSQMVDHVLEMPEGTRLMLLAPVVADRKGEHVHLMQDLMAQGFIRARINGEVYELDQPPTLDLRKKHRIDAIVDRFKIKDDIRLRLTESFETALRLADGVARIARMDDADAEEVIFSDRFACNICGYSLTELEPRLFSFNNPSGACPGCDGLGVKQYFDPDRVVVNADLPLAGGAIRGWDRKTTYYYQMIQSLASHYDFDLETPFSQPRTPLPRDRVRRGARRARQIPGQPGLPRLRRHALEPGSSTRLYSRQVIARNIQPVGGTREGIFRYPQTRRLARHYRREDRFRNQCTPWLS